MEELDWVETDAGPLTLRRRIDPLLDTEVFEVKLGDEFLMSSLFTVAEVELARLALAVAPDGDLHVVVGGLGLGYTARAALDDERVRSLTVVEALAPVIGWHESGSVPVAEELTSDPRTTFVRGDFFTLVCDVPAEPWSAGRRFDVALVDIDHSPRHLLHPSHAAFYTADGLRRLTDHLAPEGVFALWSDDAPDPEFGAELGAVFATWDAHVVAFDNPYTGNESTNTVYVASRGV